VSIKGIKNCLSRQFTKIYVLTNCLQVLVKNAGKHNLCKD